MDEKEAEEIKNQLLKQLESSQVQDKEQISQAIEKMSPDELEIFLKQNKIQSKDKEECIFCSIVHGKIPSYKIDENKKSIAILEINPLSKGHSLVLSKEHYQLSNQSFSLANKIAKRVKRKLKPEEVKIETADILSHKTIQIIPVYKNQKLEKKKASEHELILLQDKLKIKSREKKKKPEKMQELPLEQAPKRFP